MRALTPEKNSIRVWMRETMEKRDWSAEKWARLAGTSPTNITRFLKDADHMPSTATIAKLARVSGSFPQYGNRQLNNTTYCLPVVESLVHLAEQGAAYRSVDSMETTAAVSTEAIGFEIGEASKLAPGVAAGDRLVVEPAHVLDPRDGDLVVYGMEGQHWHVGQMIEGRVWSLVGGAMKPIADASVLGVAVELRRKLR